MTETAAAEFKNIYSKIDGTNEVARAERLMEKIKIIPDTPSARASNFKVTKTVDKITLKFLEPPIIWESKQ